MRNILKLVTLEITPLEGTLDNFVIRLKHITTRDTKTTQVTNKY